MVMPKCPVETGASSLAQPLPRHCLSDQWRSNGSFLLQFLETLDLIALQPAELLAPAVVCEGSHADRADRLRPLVGVTVAEEHHRDTVGHSRFYGGGESGWSITGTDSLEHNAIGPVFQSRMKQVRIAARIRNAEAGNFGDRLSGA